jgi:hypothetical protein
VADGFLAGSGKISTAEENSVESISGNVAAG